MTKSIKLSIVIPCFNESKNISVVLKKLDEILKNRFDVEVIIIDGASTDKTPETLKKTFQKLNSKKFKLILMKKRNGYGHDIMHGLSQAQGDVLAWTHADMQTDPLDVIKSFEIYLGKTGKGEKIFVKGNRKNRRFTEFFFTFGMQIMVWIILGKYLSDINAQPKLFSREFHDKYLKKGYPADFSIDLHAFYQAKTKGYKIKTLPVYFSKRLHGEAKGGGGSWKTRIQLIKRTFIYIIKLKRNLRIQNLK